MNLIGGSKAKRWSSLSKRLNKAKQVNTRMHNMSPLVRAKYFPSLPPPPRPPPPPSKYVLSGIKGYCIQVPQRKKICAGSRNPELAISMYSCHGVLASQFIFRTFWRELRIFCQVPQTSHNLQNWKWYFDLLMAFSSTYTHLILQMRRTALCQSKNKRRDVGLVWELLAACQL